MALLVDLDDTLYEERLWFDSGLAAVADWLEARFGAGDASWPEVVAQEWANGGRHGVLDRIASRTHGDAAVVVRALLHVHRTARRQLEPFPDVPRFLARSREAGLDIAVVTDGSAAVQERKWQALGLEAATLVCTGDIDSCKPDPMVFRAAACRLGLETSECLVVGDDPTRDVAGARAAGMRSIELRRPLARPVREVAGAAGAPAAADHVAPDFDRAWPFIEVLCR
jgi:putative hydrolase of the HAD superfamily